ncbi:MAG: glycosyltransferase [Alphaproteobacteria bacterium]|nr:glycosyltransferase [Alphaproteobacteria bacterium]
MPGLALCLLVPDRWKRYGHWRRAEPPLGDGFRYEVAPVRWPWAGPAQTYLHHYPDLKRIIREFQPDVIDLWEEPWSLVSVQACGVRRRCLPAAKIVAETEQNLDKVLPPPFEGFRRRTLEQADFLVGRSTQAVQVARGKGYAGPAEAVPNAVDTSLFRPMDREACRKTVRVGGFVIGYVGRLVEAKGIADLLDAVAGQSTPSTLLLAGGGADEARFRQQAERLGLGDRVRFLGGLPLHELPGWINALDVLVLPSRTTASWLEQYGRVIIEAHACGVPVIGSDSGAIPEVVGAGGRIVPERNPAALAAALDELAADPAAAREMGRLGRERALAACSWQRVAERMHEIYTRLTGQPDRTSDKSPALAAPGGAS